MNNIAIYYQKSCEEAVILAAKELGRCLKKMSHESLNISPCAEFPRDDSPAIWIGSPDAFPELIKTSELDDEILGNIYVCSHIALLSTCS